MRGRLNNNPYAEVVVWEYEGQGAKYSGEFSSRYPQAEMNAEMILEARSHDQNPPLTRTKNSLLHSSATPPREVETPTSISS